MFPVNMKFLWFPIDESEAYGTDWRHTTLNTASYVEGYMITERRQKNFYEIFVADVATGS